MDVRPEKHDDWEFIERVNNQAFEGEQESGLINRLRILVWPLVSLVAERDDQIVGHILFSPVTMEKAADLKSMGLGPGAALPESQSRGVGTALVKAGLQQCRDAGIGAVVVFGHPSYYPRFGFRPAAESRIRCHYDALPEAFMVSELSSGCLSDVSGVAKYHSAFDEDSKSQIKSQNSL